MENCGSLNRRVRFFLHSMQSCRNEHPYFYESRIAHLDAHLSGSQTGIQNRTDVADAACEGFVRISVQANFSVISDVDIDQIVFIHVAKNPNVGKIRYCEWIGRSKSLPARG